MVMIPSPHILTALSQGISVALSLRKHMEISKKLKATQMLEKKDSTRRYDTKKQ